jgi:hypothetical protein
MLTPLRALIAVNAAAIALFVWALSIDSPVDTDDTAAELAASSVPVAPN